MALMPVLAYYRSTLSSEERQRAERFSFENLRRSYTLSRGGLRILARALSWLSTERDRAHLRTKGQTGPSRLFPDRFNTSHSGQMALYAFTLGCELGIDVEQLRKLDDSESIATRFFSPAEVSELLSLNPER